MRFDWRDDWIPISAHCGVITGYCSLWVAALLIGGVRKVHTERKRRKGGREGEREGAQCSPGSAEAVQDGSRGCLTLVADAL